VDVNVKVTVLYDVKVITSIALGDNLDILGWDGLLNKRI
jgi:hypothetical protein